MKIYLVVEKETGTIRSNWSTGTRVWTRKANALAFARGTQMYKVIEYDLSLIQPKEIVDGNS
jgi:hypothetical protein